MARPTRQQRRARREEQEQSASPTQRARSRQPARPGAEPPNPQTGRREPRERGRFVRESWGELKKVEWPGRGQVVQGTIVVVIACAIVGAYLYAADFAFRNLVENVIIG